MIYKQKVKINCDYTITRMATLILEVPIEDFEPDNSLLGDNFIINEQIQILIEGALEKLDEDYADHDIISTEIIGEPKEDFEGYQEMLEQKGQQRLPGEIQ